MQVLSDSKAGDQLLIQKLRHRSGRKLAGMLIAAIAVLPVTAQEISPQEISPYAPLSRPLHIEQVPGKPVYFTIGHPGIPGKANDGNTSNAGFVVTDDGVVVYDALGTPSLGWALLQAIKKITNKPIRFVVVSHYHADHIYGLQAFRDYSDAMIIAQDRASEYKENEDTADERANERLDQRRAALAPWVNKDTRIISPVITFNDQATLSLGGKRFVMRYAGPGHSLSDMMMSVEPDGILFAGDIVQNGRIPFMNSDEVRTDNWLQRLTEVEQLDPRFIIPGHGRSSTSAKQAIAFTRDYIRHVRSVMKTAVESWLDFDAAYAQADWSSYSHLPAFMANNRGNAYRIYLELESNQLGAKP